jgi:hypothetical protein
VVAVAASRVIRSAVNKIARKSDASAGGETEDVMLAARASSLGR